MLPSVRLTDILISFLMGFLVLYVGPRLLGFRLSGRVFLITGLVFGVCTALFSELNRFMALPLGLHTLLITVSYVAAGSLLGGLPLLVSSAAFVATMLILLIDSMIITLLITGLGIDVGKIIVSPLYYALAATSEHLFLILLGAAVWRRGLVLFDATRDSPGLRGTLVLLNVFLAQSFVLLFMGLISITTQSPLWKSLPWGVSTWVFWAFITALPLGAVFLVRRLDALHRTEIDAVTNQKMAELGRLSSMLAHEVRNPITVIKGYFQLAERFIKDGGSVPFVIGQAIEFGGQQLKQLESLLSDFLVLGRMGAKEEAPVPVDLARMIHEVAEGARQIAAGRQVNIETEVAPNLPQIRAVPQRVHQLLDNLVGNALDAIPGEGRVRISAAVSDSGKSLVLKVVDTGVGMSSEVLAQIFDPFFTTKDHGTGLGLVVVRRVAKDLHARLDVKSEPGKGSEFILYIPLKRNLGTTDAPALLPH